VKFSLFFSTAHHATDPGPLAAVARHAEECGYRRREALLRLLLRLRVVMLHGGSARDGWKRTRVPCMSDLYR
jgi:hypothetical protein